MILKLIPPSNIWNHYLSSQVRIRRITLSTERVAYTHWWVILWWISILPRLRILQHLMSLRIILTGNLICSILCLALKWMLPSMTRTAIDHPLHLSSKLRLRSNLELRLRFRSTWRLVQLLQLMHRQLLKLSQCLEFNNNLKFRLMIKTWLTLSSILLGNLKLKRIPLLSPSRLKRRQSTTSRRLSPRKFWLD